MLLHFTMKTIGESSEQVPVWIDLSRARFCRLPLCTRESLFRSLLEKSILTVLHPMSIGSRRFWWTAIRWSSTSLWSTSSAEESRDNNGVHCSLCYVCLKTAEEKIVPNLAFLWLHLEPNISFAFSNFQRWFFAPKSSHVPYPASFRILPQRYLYY